MTTKKHAFKAEVRQLLDLVIHSLYSKKEIFLRELVSNASDAIERAQYEGLTDKTLVADGPQWQIGLIADKKARTLTISDNGIGMTAAEVEESLGTIARSGTKAFVESIKAKQGAPAGPELIGQFGVGFYAAFMVADEVTVVTRRRGDGQQAVQWHSTGDGAYDLDDGERAEPGTTVTLHLREGQDEYLDPWRIKELIRHYSDFIAYPIRLAEDGGAIDAAGAPLNTMRALWKRAKGEIKEEEFTEFYRHLTHDHHAPLKAIQVAAEGAIEFRALLFLPREAPFDLFMPTRRHGLSLYVRNVFIGADFEALLPEYLRFVRGVVESSDLPLNVSREMLQDDAVIRKIRSNIVGRVLATLAEMKKEKPDDYRTFYTAFGRILKEGFHFDHDNHAKLQELAMFRSARTEGDGFIALRQYRDAMPSTQTEIFYLTAESLEAARQSPHLEAVVKSGCDVLLFTDAIDQWVADELESYDGCKLRAIDKGDLELGSEADKAESKHKIEEAGKEFQPLLALIRAKLGDEVKDVRLSSRLTDSACCLVADERALNATMERMMRAMNQEVPKQARILEVNADHALLKRMKAMLEADAADPRLADFVELLHGQALLGEGSTPRNPQRFTRVLADLMAKV
jgi:molecular chaperone HtpG